MMYKNIPILLIIFGLVLLGGGIKQFFQIYRLYVQEKAKRSQLLCAGFACLNSLLFLGGGLVWLFMVYHQLAG